MTTQGSDEWDARVKAMEADVAFMRWLADYNPEFSLEYSGDLLGQYDAWLASRSGRCATCRWAERRQHTPLLACGYVKSHVVLGATSPDDSPDVLAILDNRGFADDFDLLVSASFGCVMWEAKSDWPEDEEGMRESERSDDDQARWEREQEAKP